MIKYIARSSLLIFACLSITFNASLAALLYEEDFESGAIAVGTAEPVWGLSNPINNVIGPGNHFNVTDTTSHAGKYSFRFDYSGRNNICNTCGIKYTAHMSGLDGVDYAVSDSGEDLTIDPYFAAPGKAVYNGANGFSKWEILAVENENAINDKLTLKLLKPGITSVTPEFKTGDTIGIARECGVDGFIGRDVDRRSDCNTVISYFFGMNQQPGQSIFRRVYLKAEVSSPVNHQKLRYWTLPNDSIILLSSRKNGYSEPHISGLNGFGGAAIYKPSLGTMPEFEIERGAWYYIEEEFKAESTPGAGDGAYRLWLAKTEDTAAITQNTPFFERTGLTLPPVKRASLWGNTQHWTQTVGSWYMDDIKISSDTWNGPVQFTGSNTQPPKAPDTN